ncbi:MAG: M23 family metallopeptidase [Pseudomonadota bacterium]
MAIHLKELRAKLMRTETLSLGTMPPGTWRTTLVVMVASGLTACADKTAAPVVYGSQPQWQGRVYNSPEDLAAERAAIEARRKKTAPSRYSDAGASQRLSDLDAELDGANLDGPRLDGAGPNKPENASSGFEYSAPAAVRPVEQSSLEQPAQLVRASAPERQRFDYEARPVYLSTEQREQAKKEASTLNRLASAGTVTVGKGDTVYAISRRSGVAPNDLIKANNLKAPYHLEVGQVLRVPGSTAATAPRQSPSKAPVETLKTATRVHAVRSGDTLYSISRSTGVSVEKIASLNNLKKPYTLSVGDRLEIPANGTPNAKLVASKQPTASRTPQSVSLSQSVANTSARVAPVLTNDPSELFNWPVKGAIVGKYSKGGSAKRNDGINIAAPLGTPVRAAADGEVVYRGSELEGYGNLLLIKHADGFVTAYAHNDAMIVKTGEIVRKGQVIAKVGQTGSAAEPQLHFEIRQNLKAVDPMAFLNK